MATKGNNLSAFDADRFQDCGEFHIGIVVASWNDEITHALRDGALKVLQAAGVENILVHDVPGSFELPLGCQWLLQHKGCDAVIAIGSVIRGETAHFDFVCKSAASGILRAGMDANRPAIFCVLTDDHIDQSRARSGGKHGNKGIEAAVAALEMLQLRRNLQQDSSWGVGL